MPYYGSVGEGTYWVRDFGYDTVVFNVPNGARIALVDIEISDCPPTLDLCGPAIILQEESSGSQLCLLLSTGEECNRYIADNPNKPSGQSNSGNTGASTLFDRISNSARSESP